NQFGDQPLGDALRRVPGVTFGGANRAREIQLRAIGDQYTQVLVNGRPMIDGNSRRSVQVDRIPSSLVERVEIIRSPLASLDGQGAAGTVNIILKNTNFTPRTEVGVGGGYLEENGWIGDATLFQAGEAGALKYSIAAGLQRQRRAESKDTYVFNGAGAPNGGELGINEREYNQFNILPSFELSLTPQDVLRFEPSYLYTEENRDDIKSRLVTNHQGINRVDDEFRHRVRENYGIYSAWIRDMENSGKFTLSFDQQWASEDTTRDARRYNGSGVFQQRRKRTEDVDIERTNPAFRYDNQLGAHEFAFGFDFSRSTRDEDNSDVTIGSPPTFAGNRIFDVREDRWNVFVQDSWQLTESTRLTGGLRLEDSDTRTRDVTGDANSVSETFLLPSLHLVQRLEENTDFRIGIARTLRRPDLRELTPTISEGSGTIANPYLGGNPDQTPESIWGLDSGFDYYFLDRKGLVAINGFARKFDDKIETLPELEGSDYVSRPRNVGDGELYGVELEGRVPLEIISLPQLTLWGNATWVHTELDDPFGGTRRFADQHDAVANLGLDYYVEAIRTTFGVSANWVSGYDQRIEASNGTSQRTHLDDMVRLDFSSRTQITDKLSMSVSFLNLLGSTEKMRVDGYNTAGSKTSVSKTYEETYRSAYVKLNYAF
ncbi:MAG TPA: TonB-dependent receptor, partial [Luteolibacter sp.]|nr:TonB-dependent receptor [Luteolibacter sp.]